MPSTSISRLPFAIAWGAWIASTLVIELRWPESTQAWTVVMIAFMMLTLVAIISDSYQLPELLSDFLACGWSRPFLAFGWLSCILLRLFVSDPPQVMEVDLPRVLIVFGMATWLSIHFLLGGKAGFIGARLRTGCREPRDGSYSRAFAAVWTAWGAATAVVEVLYPQTVDAWLMALLVFVVVEGIGVRTAGKDTWSELIWEVLGSGISRVVVALPWIAWISLRLLFLEGTPPSNHGVPFARVCFAVCLLGSLSFLVYRLCQRRSDVGSSPR